MPETPRSLIVRSGRPGIGTGRRIDATDGLRAELALRGALLREQATRLSRQDRAAAAARGGFWECRLRDETLDWTGAVYDLFEIPRGAPLHRGRILDLYAPSSHRLLTAIRERAIAGCRGFRLDAEIVTLRGQSRWIRISASVESRGGRPVRLFGMKQDVTEEIARIAELSRRAERDAMTGLANRRAFEERFLHAPRSGDPAGAALVLVDLDDFKQVNDGHGHAAGDLAIRQAAAHLAQIGRDADLVARIGGDEFALVVSDSVDPRILMGLGRRLVEAIGRPIAYQGRSLRVGASVGIAFGRRAAPIDLFRRADEALYAAKAAGRNTVRIADSAARLA